MLLKKYQKNNLFGMLILCMFIIVAQCQGAAQLKKPCPAQLQQSTRCVPCSLTAWAEKVALLKERPVEFSSLPSKKKYQATILTRSEFLSTIKKCAHTMAECCKADALWLKKKSVYTLAPEIFALDRPYKKPADSIENFIFKPYVQRLLVEPHTTCALFGDLHGSAHSLIRDIVKLKSMGYLDDQFKIIAPHFYLIFLGDYIDRGIYGVEVMYTLARLKIANPQKVLLIRGNHEDYILAPDFRKKHTKEEEKDNTPSLIDELYRKFDMSEKDEVTLFRLYETLPVALYLGCASTLGEKSPHTDYMMCCHGGLEIGYNPYALLHAPVSISFELIERLWRKKNYNEKLSKNAQDMIKLAFPLDTLCADIQDFIPKAPFYKVSPDHSAYLGLMWNDFYVDPTKTVGQRGKKFTGWVWGPQLTHEVLDWSSSEKVTLQGIFRAHQHNNETGGPMLNLLCCKKGIARIWDTIESKEIYTLVSAPDSKLEETGENCFTYDSFVLVTTAAEFKDWKMVHYTQDNGMQQKQWKKRVLSQGLRKSRNTAASLCTSSFAP